MTKSAENDPTVRKLLRQLEKETGTKFPLPAQWGATRAKKKLRTMIKLFDPHTCPVCGRKHTRS